MRSTRIVALVIGCSLFVPGIGLVAAGAGLGVVAAMQGEDGYIDLSLGQLTSDGVAVTAEDLALVVEPDTPVWFLGLLSVDTRLVLDTTQSAAPIFAGVAPAGQVASFLDGASHTRVAGVENDRFFSTDQATPLLEQQPGGVEVTAPADQGFWAASVSGTGTQVLDWQLADGRWTVVLMNVDGSPGVTADAEVGVQVGQLWPMAIVLALLGPLLTAIAVILVVVGARASDPTGPTGEGGVAGSRGPVAVGTAVEGSDPVSLSARLDPDLSRGLWLVKWAMAIPHLLVLSVLWVAFVVVTIVAGLAILFTGVYPRAMFDFNVGVMRWSWRVSYFAASGGLGTDTYPPFSLQDDPSYPARLEVAYPERLSRGLVLVKWWLLAIPHYLILGLLIGGTVYSLATGFSGTDIGVVAGGGLLGLLVLVAALVLLVTGRYPPQLFDLVIGLNRWVYRVVAYAALMTDTYPPFRLDQGGPEPVRGRPGPPPPPAPEREPALTH